MENGNQFNNEEIFSKKVRAGRRRTYFFDVRTTRSNDYYVTITESKKRFDSDGYERHKLHLYKEDFNKFLKAFEETVEHVKTELMPDYDYDEFTRDEEEYSSEYNQTQSQETQESEEGSELAAEEEYEEEDDGEDADSESWD